MSNNNKEYPNAKGGSIKWVTNTAAVIADRSLSHKRPTVSFSPTISSQPSIIPTATNVPTIQPTLTLSLPPTVSPTTTKSPSRATSRPSSSTNPSISPSTSHGPTPLTPKPTRTSSPSALPSILPSHDPTLVHSFSPSIHPTSSPSDQASLTPTVSHSLHPTEFHTDYPTPVPSISPTTYLMNVDNMNVLSSNSLTENNDNNKGKSFGIMFDIHATHSILIQSFSLSLTKTASYEIYTKAGSFLDDDGMQDKTKWHLVSRGILSPTQPIIPVRSVRGVNVSMGDSQAIYIVLTSPSLIYTSSLPRNSNNIGSVYLHNDDFTTAVGRIITSKAMFVGGSGNNNDVNVDLFTKGGWTGEIYYIVTERRPTRQPVVMMMPSMIPSTTRMTTISPTITPMIMTAVTYKFRVSKQKPVFRDDIMEQVRTSVIESMGEILMEINEGNAIVEYDSIPQGMMNDVTLVMVKGVFDGDDCVAPDESTTCYYMTITSTLSHAANFLSEDVKFMFLAFKDFVADNLPFQQEYVGSQPLITDTTISLKGDQLSEMESNDRGAFEDVVKGFLVKQKPDIDILKVKVTRQNITLTDESNTSDRTSRKRQRPHHHHDDKQQQQQRRSLALVASSIDVTCTITGEYMPPPEVKIEEIVEESFANEKSITFIEELKKEVVTFEKVKEINIEAKPMEVKPFSPMEWAERAAEQTQINPTVTTTSNNPSSESSFWMTQTGMIVMTVGGTLIGMTLLVILFLLMKRRNEKLKKSRPIPLDMMMMPGIGLSDEFMSDAEKKQKRLELQQQSMKQQFSSILMGSSRRIVS